MWTFYSDAQRLHHPKLELMDGELVPVYETPERADVVLQHVRARDLGPVAAASDHGLSAAARIHAADYLDYLAHAFEAWSALGRSHDILPYCFPVRGMGQVRPTHPNGLAGYYAMDTSAPITAGTWQAARGSLDCALSALARITEQRERAAFALCRPPGHHAGSSYLAGYCYLNNAAIAAQQLIDLGSQRVAVLDVDYHHGNGTQQIFYERSDVLFLSLHGHPASEYPYFLGHADERGAGAGLGYNLNFPLHPGTDFAAWHAALDQACRAIDTYAPDALVVSLGVDTYKDDPIARFRLETSDYLRVGERIAACRVPTLFVMEGGYAIEALGPNVVNVLEGFESR
ncbi:MAG: histone deacetylase family protein [Polyangiales bacterium]